MSQSGNVLDACLASTGCYSGVGVQQVHCCVALQAQHVIQDKPALSLYDILDKHHHVRKTPFEWTKAGGLMIAEDAKMSILDCRL